MSSEFLPEIVNIRERWANLKSASPVRLTLTDFTEASGLSLSCAHDVLNSENAKYNPQLSTIRAAEHGLKVLETRDAA